MLFGTLAPLIYEAAGWGKISVGFPWFNKMFIAISPFLVLAMGIGPLARWKQDPGLFARRDLWVAAAISVLIAAVSFVPAVNDGQLLVGLGAGLTAWLVITNLIGLADRLRHKGGLKGVWADFAGNSRSYYGMLLAHLGVAAFIVGATMVSNYGTETDVRMSPGDVVESAGYRFQFNGVQTVPGPNYNAQRGEFIVYKGDEQVTVLHPEKRSYFAGSRPMTEAAIDAGFLRDIYVSLGEPVGDQGDWALRVYYKPYVRWIWLAGILMALGGILAVTDRRYRIARRPATVPSGAGAVARG